MSLVIVAQLVSTSAYLGFQWTVQGLVYRQFDAVPVTAFAAYERSHQRRTSIVVGPLFAGLVMSTLALVVWQPASVPVSGAWLSVVLLSALLATTAFAAVPLHRRLDAGWDVAAYQRLLVVDGVRLGIAVLNVITAVWMALG